MITGENLIWFFFVIVVSLIIAYVIVKFVPKGSISREDQLELEIKQLVKRTASLQDTIDILSNRITDLQGQVAKLKEENERLRNDLSRYLPMTQWKTNELSAIRNALGRLSADEFKRITFEQFRPVFDSFGADQTLQAQRLALVEYAENHNQLNLLRTIITDINPAAFSNG